MEELGNKEKNWMRLEFPGDSGNEEFARVTAAVFASRLDLTLEEMNDIKTAVSEAVTNCVIHGYRQEKGTIRLEAFADERKGEIYYRIKDQGCGIADVKRAMEPMYTSDPSGERSGMGFSFMEAFMDRVEVSSEPGQGTEVLLYKRIQR